MDIKYYILGTSNSDPLSNIDFGTQYHIQEEMRYNPCSNAMYDEDIK